ncbi:MAG: cupin domain-containing protein [Thermaerobacter sp.]|nr:cupin domain-containing protein [Thermaerobacter sp.]
MAEVTATKNGAHYTVAEAGNLGELEKKEFIAQTLGFTGMQVSLNRATPGQASPYLHAHRQHEELYLFLSGTGEFQVDGDVLPVKPGTMIRVAPEGQRAWRNNSSSDLLFIVVQANVGTLTGQDGIRLDGDPSWPA